MCCIAVYPSIAVCCIAVYLSIAVCCIAVYPSIAVCCIAVYPSIAVCCIAVYLSIAVCCIAVYLSIAVCYVAGYLSLIGCSITCNCGKLKSPLEWKHNGASGTASSKQHPLALHSTSVIPENPQLILFSGFSTWHLETESKRNVNATY